MSAQDEHPRHSDEHPRLGKEAAIFLKPGDIMVMTGTAQEYLEHKTIPKHVKISMDAPLRCGSAESSRVRGVFTFRPIRFHKPGPHQAPAATGKDEPAEIATPPALSIAARSAEVPAMSVP